MAVSWTLADVIVKLRKQKKWGRQKLSERAHVSYTTITRLETGREMKEASIRAVAGAFGLPLADLYALVPIARVLSADERAWLELLRQLPEESRQTVLGVARSYAPAPSEEDPPQGQTPPAEIAAKDTGSGRGRKRA
jgi:transcriptional regulator with XRE-family HTH domain